MAVFDYTRPFTDTRGVIGRVYGVVTASVGTLIAWNDARVTRNALRSLSDRELDDLGLVRGDIEDIALGELRR